MAIVQVLDKAFIGEGLNAPTIKRVDEIETHGSLLLFDASKYNGSFENNVILPNLLDEYSKKVTGAESSMTLITSLNAQISKIERSTKGGLHFITNPNLDYGQLNDYAAFRGIGGVKDYMRAHAVKSSVPHAFYISLWYRLTTLQQSTATDYTRDSYISNYSHNGNHNLERVYHINISNNTPIGTHRTTVTTSVNPADVHTQPLSTTNFNIFNFGTNSINYLGRATKKYPSTILYRAYVEDLTVSGRTSAEVNALDEAIYTKAFAEGGRFYGDTWTDSSTAF